MAVTQACTFFYSGEFFVVQEYLDSNGAQPWRKLAKTEDSDEVRTNSNNRENQSCNLQD
jgi:hypothetical protein